jgi:hypothetical protein
VSSELDIPRALRWAKWIAGVVVAIVVATVATIAYVDRRIETRSETIAKGIMMSMRDQLRVEVAQAAADGAERAVTKQVEPLKERIGRLEGWRDGLTAAHLDTSGARR